MNKELKEAIDAVICSTICNSLDTPNLAFEVKRRLHEGILEAVWDFLHKNPAKYAAALQSTMQETSVKDTPILTARDARSATLQARTWEGFLRAVMDDIGYQTRGGLNTMTITEYSTDYKVEYFPKLIGFLHSMGYEVTQSEHPEIRRVGSTKRVKLSICW